MEVGGKGVSERMRILDLGDVIGGRDYALWEAQSSQNWFTASGNLSCGATG